MLSYRSAFIGLMGAGAALVLFAAADGMPLRLALSFFGLYGLMILAITRLRAEAGPLRHYGPDMSPHRLLTHIPGPRAWDGAALTSLTYFVWFDSDYRTAALPAQVEASVLATDRVAPRPLGRALLAAAALAIASSFVYVAALYYQAGASTPRGDNGWRYYNGRMPFEMLSSWIADPNPPEPQRLPWVGLGLAITLLLGWARSRLVWWPLHPAGFALGISYAMNYFWCCVFVAWGIKWVLIRYGGMSAHRRAIPFFLGLVLGDYTVGAIWSLVALALEQPTYKIYI